MRVFEGARAMQGNEQCESYKYWKKADHAEAFGGRGATGAGQCRKRPPTATGKFHREERFPFSAFDDWCDAYKKRQSDDA